MNRVKVSVSIDPGLLQAVDTYVQGHHGLDRSKVIDEALGFWAAAQQSAAMEAQYAGQPAPMMEREGWRSIRRNAASRKIGRS